MATLVLQTAGAIAGNFLGGPIGAAIGQAAGAIAGNMIDRRVLGSIGAANAQGPRLNGTPIASAAEGTPIPRVYGRARVGGTIVWMTRFEEVATTKRSGDVGGKGGGPKTTTYRYFANFAVGVCEGPIADIRRIWADGKELDQTEVVVRCYRGDEEQQADALIVAKEGADNAPAYRDLAYVVFERLPLEDFGNRLPVLSFEVVRPLEAVTKKITSVCLIPGSSEYAYDPASRLQYLRPGVTRGENRHQLMRESDWAASLDMLQALCPNLQSVSLVVTWFGDDLRAGNYTIRPKVELANKTTDGAPWEVAGLNRFTSQEVSRYKDAPAYGGTPNDAAVIAAIQDMKQRGLDVVFYPFVMMDIPGDNALPDPWTGAGAQPAYPWRGRITCDPAPGQAGSPDAMATAGAQVDAFFGSLAPPEQEWSFRRFILHYAGLCASAGGVNAFLVGSELAALTRVRSAPGVYPAANHLATLASEAAALLPAAKISYAADWTEYVAHSIDGGSEVRFPLDVVWGNPAVSLVGIDVYWPLSDWRDGTDHLDAQTASRLHDTDYLARGYGSGEGYDWYYPDVPARETQARLPITDGAYGKPWVFRQKDIVGWWSNPHYERVAGQELAQPTAWGAQSKPIWFTEFGCPAVDKGANAPNVFPDEKSSESRLPYFSSGARDDLIQGAVIEATLDRFSPGSDAFEEAHNPASPLYGGRMVDETRMHVWAWDARPFPAFPTLANVWADAAAWTTGHWINGRLDAVSLNALSREILGETLPLADWPLATELSGMIDGYVVDRPMSPRAMLEPLATLFAFDAVASGGILRIRDRQAAAAQTIYEDDLAVEGDNTDCIKVRLQETELPRGLAVTLYDSMRDYRTATVQSRRLEGGSQREQLFDLPVVANPDSVRTRADMLLQDQWISRETAEFLLPPSKLMLEIGDHVRLQSGSVTHRYRVIEIDDGAMRRVSAVAVEPEVFANSGGQSLPSVTRAPDVFGPPQLCILDLAIARDEPEALQYVAAFSDPWPGQLAVWRVAGTAGAQFVRTIDKPAIMGTTLSQFGPGPVGRYDMRNALDVALLFGALPSLDERLSLSGSHAIAVEGPDGGWEILTYANAELLDDRRYRLTTLVRGLGGADYLAARSVPAGARFVVLDDAVVPLTTEIADRGIPIVYRIGPARRDYADATYVEHETTATSLALKPYTPVRPTARRSDAGVGISFIRRGRLGADAWNAVEIPLGEAVERYEIDVLDGTSVLRTLHATSPQVLYPQIDEIADFGATQEYLSVRIFQISQGAGRGFPLAATLPIT